MKSIAVIGGTSGIGQALVSRYLADGGRVIAVGRGIDSTSTRPNLMSISADISLLSEQDRVAERLANEKLDRLVFTAGGLSAKARVTAEGKDAAYMVNHVARARLAAALTPTLVRGAHVGFITAWGSYKKPPREGYVFGEPGRDGLGHVLNTYVPNDETFAELALQRPDLHVLGYNPGPTRGTKLAKRAESPQLLKVILPAIHLFARDLNVVGAEFYSSLEAARPGIAWAKKAYPLARPPHLTPDASIDIGGGQEA